MGFKSTLTPLLGSLRASQGPSMGGACASTPTGGIVHKSDLKSGIETCQMEHRAVLVEFDGFEFIGGCFWMCTGWEIGVKT
jgi:hypothetical protein